MRPWIAYNFIPLDGKDIFLNYDIILHNFVRETDCESY
jgi:hypothetical protein